MKNITNLSHSNGISRVTFCSILLLIMMTMLLSSCSDLVSPERFTENQYTVNALLKSGTSISVDNPVSICKVPGLNLPDVFVLDAVVTIKEYQKNPGTDSYDILNKQFALSLGMHSLNSFGVVPCYYDPANNLIQADYKYHIDVTIPGYDKIISADTIVPQAAELVPNFNYDPPAGQGFITDPADTDTSIPYGEVNNNFPVSVKLTDAGTQQTVNYIVEVYCREEFSTDLEYTTVIMGFEHPTEADKDKYMSSGDSIRRFMVMSKFMSKQHTDGNWYVSWTDYRQAFMFYGRYRITALVLDDNYFNYRSMQEGYYHGGVKNALGCFGSASGGVMYTKIVK